MMKTQHNPICRATIESEKMFEAGKTNPITLPLINIEKIRQTLGKKLADGGYSTIHRVKDSQPPRVYKIIPLNQFKSGNEIRISKIAAEIGVAPAFHQAFLLKQNVNKYVVIEMDDAGKTMGNWMEDLFEDTKVEENSVELGEGEQALSEKERRFQEMLKKMHAKIAANDRWVATNIKKKAKLPLKDAVNKMYKRPEEFYYELFSKIKMLAEVNIAYGDSHAGNIMPHYDSEKSMQLIDFDTAKLTETPESALLKSMKSPYNQIHFKHFTELLELSEKSRELIRLFSFYCYHSPKSHKQMAKKLNLE